MWMDGQHMTACTTLVSVDNRHVKRPWLLQQGHQLSSDPCGCQLVAVPYMLCYVRAAVAVSAVCGATWWLDKLPQLLQ